jgi:hypothetical protein
MYGKLTTILAIKAPVEWELKVRSVPLGRAISRKLARRYSVIKRSKQ